MVTQRTHYALKAVLELSLSHGGQALKTAGIARAQGIPDRFLAAILHGLTQAGLVASKRGASGGYVLARSPRTITVGAVVDAVQRPLLPAAARGGVRRKARGAAADCVLDAMWQQARVAVADVLDRTTFQSLVDQLRELEADDYVI